MTGTADELAYVASQQETINDLRRQLAKYRRLAQTVDAVLAQAVANFSGNYKPGTQPKWYDVPSDAIRDLRAARVETERG